MSSHQATTPYFNSLTGIRAIAAYMVFMHHNNIIPKGTIGHNFISELHVGVTVFFVLSGFLIAHRYMELPNFSFRNYMLNRFARIFPVYFFLTILVFWLNGELSRHNLFVIGLNITMLKGYFYYLKNSGIWQGWSLTVEETFYFLAPMFFILIRYSRIFLIVLPVLLIVTGVGSVYYFSQFFNYGFFNNYEFLFNYIFFGRCSEFFAGICLAIILKKNLNTKVKGFTYFGIAVIVISVFLISLLKGDADFGIRHPLGILINTLLLPFVGIAPLFWGLINESTVISKILGSKLFVLLGKSSYVFYLIHMGVITSLIPIFFQEFPVISLMISFIILNVLSILIFYFIEEPLNNFIRKLNLQPQN